MLNFSRLSRRTHRIVKALIAREQDEAERAAREHVEATMKIVEPALHF